MRFVFTALCLCCWLGFSSFVPVPVADSSAQAAGTGALRIRFTGLKSGEGKFKYVVFAIKDKDSWPTKLDKALMVKIIPLNTQSLEVLVPNLPFGKYAITCMHDENGNGDMDYNFLGLPLEGWGFSNATPNMRAAKWEEAEVTLGTPELRVTVPMRYL